MATLLWVSLLAPFFQQHLFSSCLYVTFVILRGGALHQQAWGMMGCPTALGGQVGAQVAMLSGRSCIRPGSEGDLEVEMNSVVLRGPGASRRSAFSRPEPRPDVLTRPQGFFPQGRADLRYSSTVAPRAKPGMCLLALALPACPLHRLGD